MLKFIQNLLVVTLLTSSLMAQSPADFDKSGRVDFPDFLIFAQTFAQSQPDPGQIVTFPDINLETAIRQALQKPTGDLKRSDVLSLTELLAHNHSITNLTGIEHLENLQTLELPQNQITDLSPLSNLINLRKLELAENSITDIAPLAHLINLERLYLMRNQISDIAPLESLTKLKALFLLLNRITNITTLANLTNLEELELDENDIANIDVLVHLTKLHTLDLIGNQIMDLQALLDNIGINSGDEIFLGRNPLSTTALTQQIPTLESRGVVVDLQ